MLGNGTSDSLLSKNVSHFVHSCATQMLLVPVCLQQTLKYMLLCPQLLLDTQMVLCCIGQQNNGLCVCQQGSLPLTLKWG